MIHIVLGTFFGDEGKGSFVNHLARNAKNEGKKPIVIRFSGGSQSGHTVIQNGVNHTFSNVGAGALSGVDTLWSKYCLFEPGAFMTEVRILKEKGINPVVFVDNKCQVVTPYDRFQNEIDLHNLADGSCGHGIGKTMNRIENSPVSITVGDLYAPKWVLDHKLEQVRKYWLKKNYGIPFPTVVEKKVEMFRKFIDQFVDTYPNRFYDLSSYNYYIFEGSQGILLDRERGLFPHVTYANTTSKNAWKIINEEELNKKKVTTYFITRSYLTRHGNGPMGGFEEKLSLINNTNEINVLNKFQGDFRTAPFDFQLYKWAIDQDCGSYGYIRTVVTCMDQLPETVPVRVTDRSVIHLPHNEFKELFPEDTLFSYSPEFKLYV